MSSSFVLLSLFAAIALATVASNAMRSVARRCLMPCKEEYAFPPISTACSCAATVFFVAAFIASKEFLNSASSPPLAEAKEEVAGAGVADGAGRGASSNPLKADEMSSFFTSTGAGAGAGAGTGRGAGAATATGAGGRVAGTSPGMAGALRRNIFKLGGRAVGKG